MPFPIAAAIGAGGSLLGSVMGGKGAAKSAKKAAKITAAASDRSIAEQSRQYGQTRSDFAPYREVGYEGLSGLGDLIGTNGGEAQSAAIAALQASPFYQSLFNNGEEALMQNASATGGMRGGNTQRGLADFGADTLMQTIQQQLQSLGGLAGMGMGSTQAVANFGAGKANAISGTLERQGQYGASAALAQGGIQSQLWNNAGSMLGNLGARWADPNWKGF